MEEIMKRAFVLVVLAGVLIFGLAISASAASNRGVAIKVPFAFEAGDQLLPAGTYYFELTKNGGYALGSMLRVTSKDGGICHYLLSRTIPGVRSENDWHISFVKYGDTYFLAKVRNNILGAELSKSKTEKQMADEFLHGQKAVANVELQSVYSRAR
jgi:hypothetical protein